MTDNLSNENLQPVQEAQPQAEFALRRLNFFTLILKTFLGFAGGVIGSLILLVIFLAAASILQPVLLPSGPAGDQVNAVFIMVLMGMIFVTTMITSIITPLLLSLTERERYNRINSAIYQIFILNLVIFLFVAPIYLTASTTSLVFIAYAAGLQIVLVTTASALIMEIVHEDRYPLMAVYSSILGVLLATATALFLYQFMQSGTVLLFAILPLTWTLIGFFQAAIPIFYYWYYTSYGVDFLATTTDYGSDYSLSEEEEEEEQKPEKDDSDGSDFLKS